MMDTNMVNKSTMSWESKHVSRHAIAQSPPTKLGFNSMTATFHGENQHSPNTITTFAVDSKMKTPQLNWKLLKAATRIEEPPTDEECYCCIIIKERCYFVEDETYNIICILYIGRWWALFVLRLSEIPQILTVAKARFKLQHKFS